MPDVTRKTISEPGIYRDFDSASYFADPCPEPSLSQSIGKLIVDRSAWHVRSAHPRLATADIDDDEAAEKYVKAQAIGNAAHEIMLGRGKSIEVVKFNDFKGGEAKKLRDAAYAEGRAPILEKHMTNAEQMVAAAWSQLDRHEDRDAFSDGDGEVMIAWQEDGVWFRSLIDWLHADLRTIDDYKTTGMSVAPHVLGIRAEAGGWDTQAAFISRGLDVLDPNGAGRRTFRFIAQENSRPYALNVMHVDNHWMTMGRKHVDAAVARWKSAIKNGNWQGYPSRGIVPEYPGFRESQWLDREMSGEFEQDPTLIMAG